jgi:hypothetical protein
MAAWTCTNGVKHIYNPLKEKWEKTPTNCIKNNPTKGDEIE